MQFIKSRDARAGATALAERLRAELTKGKPVLWIVSGGSNIPISAEIMRSLPEALTPHLLILLSDERFGPPGHQHSNYKQLLDAGFDTKQALFPPVLLEGLTLAEVTRHYAEVIERIMSQATVIISQLGIGSDGHIAGILPHSPPVTATELVTHYEASPYTRITMTMPALRHIHADYSLVFGAEKQAALERLQHQDLPLEEQPSQILTQLPEAYVYTDQTGEETP